MCTPTFFQRSSDGGSSRKNELCTIHNVCPYKKCTAPRFEAFVRGRCPRRESSRTRNSCAVTHWSAEPLAPPRHWDARARVVGVKSRPTLLVNASECERRDVRAVLARPRAVPLVRPVRGLAHSRRATVVRRVRRLRCVSKATKRLGTRARRSRKRRSRSRRTARRGERRSMPPHARSANARSARVFVSSRSAVSVPYSSSAHWRDSPRKRAPGSSDLENTIIIKRSSLVRVIETPQTRCRQTSARIATARPQPCALAVRRTLVRTRPTTRRLRTRRRRTTARRCTPANSAP